MIYWDILAFLVIFIFAKNTFIAIFIKILIGSLPQKLQSRMLGSTWLDPAIRLFLLFSHLHRLNMIIIRQGGVTLWFAFFFGLFFGSRFPFLHLFGCIWKKDLSLVLLTRDHNILFKMAIRKFSTLRYPGCYLFWKMFITNDFISAVLCPLRLVKIGCRF